MWYNLTKHLIYINECAGGPTAVKYVLQLISLQPLQIFVNETFTIYFIYTYFIVYCYIFTNMLGKF